MNESKHQWLKFETNYLQLEKVVNKCISPVDTGRKLNERRLLSVLFTFSLRPVSTWSFDIS